MSAVSDEGSRAAEDHAAPIGIGRAVAIAVMFVLSGASALIYEVVWTRQLTTLFGATIYAVATVLTAFMGGLALGSWLIGRRADRIERPLLAYGLLEIGIGAAAVAFPFLLRWVTPIIGSFYATGGEGTFFLFSLVRFLIAFVLLMIPTTLMGATLPVLSRAVAHDLKSIGHAVGGLYALNTLGAVLGVFSTGFFLLERLGVWHSTLFAVGVNVAVATLAGLLGWSLKVPPAASLEPAADSPRALYSDKIVRVVLASYFFSGFVALCYQVAWTRSLLFGFETLKATTYSFAGMLTIFLLGLAIGSAIMQALVDRVRDLLVTYAFIQILLGVAGALSPFIILTPLPIFFRETTEAGDLIYWGAIGNVMVRTALTIGVPTLLMGMAFPVVARIVIGSLGRLGRDIGTVYAVNTCGAIAGSFLGGFILLPALGITLTICVLATISFLIAATMIALHPSVKLKQRPLVVGMVLVIGGVFVARLGAGTNRMFHPLTLGEKMIFYDEGPLATVSVIQDSKGWRTIYVDAVGVAGTDPVLQTDQKSLAHVPMVLLGGAAENVLTVGFGSGGASYSYTLYPEIKNIHAIEITSTVPSAAYTLTDANHGITYRDSVVEDLSRQLGPNDKIPGVEGAAPSRYPLGQYSYDAAPGFKTFDPRYRIIMDDARAYLRFTDTEYDVIATDCTDLRYKSNANLYDLEYFKLCRERISDRGLVVVWMPLAGLSDEAFRIVVRTFKEVFPEMTVWYFTNQPTHYCLFIGQKDGVKIKYEDVVRALENPEIQTDMNEIGLREPAKLIASFVTDERGLDQYVGDGPLNTEDYPIIEFLSPKYGYDARPVAENMGRLYDVQVPVWNLVVDKDFPAAQQDREKMLAYQRANEILFEGHSLYREFRFVEAAKAYLEAKRVAPEDESIDRLLNFDELRLLLEEQLKSTTGMNDPLWMNAQYIAYNLGRVYELQGRHSDAVGAMAPFERRLPEPGAGLPPELAKSGVMLNEAIADCYEATGNSARAAEYRAEAEKYRQYADGNPG